MLSFTIALVVLIAGYFTYGKFVSRVFGQDPSRVTPVHRMADGVDYVELPTWKIFLIQFLNIAGLGPIFGAIMGVMFGPAAFLWIVFGTIFAGAVHDYLSGMLSLRRDGASLPEIVGAELGGGVKTVMRVFALLLMILVGAVFVYNPADLLAMLTPDHLDKIFWIVVIFSYYMLATLLPIDKLIGKLYPLFGIALIFMALGIMTMLYVHADGMPEIWEQFYNHKADPEASPIFPMMFVSIACGAISGFHATQSPMMARCLKNERHARPVFYGAMVTEGIVALIWAAAAITFTGGYSGLQDFLGNGSPAILVNDISKGWLGTFGGILAILGVELQRQARICRVGHHQRILLLGDRLVDVLKHELQRRGAVGNVGVVGDVYLPRIVHAALFRADHALLHHLLAVVYLGLERAQGHLDVGGLHGEGKAVAEAGSALAVAVFYHRIPRQHVVAATCQQSRHGQSRH